MLCLTVLLASSAFAQEPSSPTDGSTALVTFYSSGSGWTLGKHGKFIGQILDGPKKLALLKAGRFVTFHLDPGKHIFTADSWMGPSMVPQGRLELDLAAGQHYYVAAYLDNRGVLFSRFRLEHHSCHELQKETTQLTPLKTDHLREYGRSHVVTESSFPACIEPPATQQAAASAN